MNKLGLIFLFLFCYGITLAQNPFEDYGYEPQIGTLSKGKYIEHFDNDSLVRIGTVVFNTYTNTITKFVIEETTFTEAGAEPTVMSRWWQADPMAEEFPEDSPYVFVKNNPMKYVDPTGAFPIQADDWFQNQDTGEVVYYDSTDQSLSNEDGEWQNVGATTEEVKETLNISEDKNVTWNTATAIGFGGNNSASTPAKRAGFFGGVIISNIAKVGFELNVSDTGKSGELISGKSKITGVNINVTLSSQTSAPGIGFESVTGNFGIAKYNPILGKSNGISSSNFSPLGYPLLSNDTTVAGASATMSLSMNQWAKYSKNFSQKPNLTIMMNSSVNYQSQYTSSTKSNRFSTSNQLRF